MEKQDALKKIYQHYETEDTDEIFLAASSERVGSGHMETPLAGGRIVCDTCGELTSENPGDPIYHPEQYLC